MSRAIDLSGRVALVTGGTRGIGLATAEALADAGADVVPTARTPDDVTAAVAAVREHGAASIDHPVDVTDPDALDALVERTVDELGGLDVLVNDAGVNPVTGMGPPETVPTDEFDHTVAVNLRGAFDATRAAGPHLTASQHGCVVNVASVSGLVGTPRQHAYTASKHGLVGLTKSTALDWAPGVRVNALAPGYVSTDLTAPIEDDPDLHESILDDVPAGRFADPTEIADAALFLASDMASYLTGATLVADGGYTAR